MTMTTEGIIYIVAISLQLAGAELLIMNYWSKPIEKLKKEELDKEVHIDGGTLFLGGRSENEIMKNIWLNRFAFLMIAFGYVVGIFGDLSNCSKWIVLLNIVLLSVVLASIAYNISAKLNR